MTVLVSAEDFAHSLGRDVRSIYDARYRGGDLPPAITVGGRLYFAQADINEWIDGKRSEAVAQRNARQQAIALPSRRTTPIGANRSENDREPRAFDGNRGSLNTTASRGVSYE